MATNPFLAARVPQQLVNKIEEQCKESGESKTELIIKILSAYFDLPIEVKSRDSREITKEMFISLENRVHKLEELLKLDQSTVRDYERLLNTTDDNNDKNSDNKNIQGLEKLPEPSNIIKNDNVNDNTIKLDISTQEQETEEINDNYIDNVSLQFKKEYSSFKSLTSDEVEKLTGLSSQQINNGLKGIATQMLKKQGKTVIPKELLQTPIEINNKKPINIDQHAYKVEYLGQNSDGKNLWNLIPNKSESRQIEIPKIPSTN